VGYEPVALGLGVGMTMEKIPRHRLICALCGLPYWDHNPFPEANVCGRCLGIEADHYKHANMEGSQANVDGPMPVDEVPSLSKKKADPEQWKKDRKRRKNTRKSRKKNRK